MKTGITFGVWDLFHYGHLRFLIRAKEHVDRLVVGVCGDELNQEIKNESAIFSQDERLEIIKSLKCVFGAFIYNKPEYRKEFENMGCNLLIVGEEFGRQGVKEHADALTLPHIRITRTPNISTTMIRKYLVFDRGCRGKDN